MKVVFLDIDGVLNVTGGDYAGREHPLDPDAITRLNRIAAETGAVGVLTTSWRLMLAWPRCKQVLHEHGLEMELVGETRDLWGAGEHLEDARRREIEQWLAENPAVDRYVILDDVPLYPDEHPRFVRTDEMRGLTDVEVELALAALR